MDLTSRSSFDGQTDRTNQQQQEQQQSGFEETLRSDQSSLMDFSKHTIFVERTLAIVKPDAVQKANEIESIVLENGFTILHVCFYFFDDRIN